MFESWLLRKRVEARLIANAINESKQVKPKWASDADLAAMGFGIG